MFMNVDRINPWCFFFQQTELQGTTGSPLEKGKEKNVAKLSNYTDEQQGGEVRNSWRLRQTNAGIYHLLLRVAHET